MSFQSSTTREPPGTCDGMPGIMLRVAFEENADMIAGNEVWSIFNLNTKVYYNSKKTRISFVDCADSDMYDKNIS